MYHLDLTHLNELYNLPCYISDEDKLGDSAIIIKATSCQGNFTYDDNKKYFEGFFSHKINKGETLNDFLMRIYDTPSYRMDCSSYVQLISYVLKGNWPIDGGEIDLYYPLWETKIKEATYIRFTSDKAFEIVDSLPISSRGQWVIEIGYDQYLGLAMDGPKILSFSDWTDLLLTDIDYYYKSERCVDEHRQDIKKLSDKYLSSEWFLYC